MKKITVTVAISAYNEEKNIINFLQSVLTQKEKGFSLKEIWVHSDGSTDQTVRLAKSLKSKKIKVWDHKKRVGKSIWLNRIYKNLATDLLVQSDADVIFAHPFVIYDLIQPIIKDSKVGMSGGNPKPIVGKSFWEKAVRVAFEPYQDFRLVVRNGNNAFSAVGQLLAFRKELVKKITVPKDMVVNDTFTYFCCLSLGSEYRYVPAAVVIFRSPIKFRDLLRQNTRFHVGFERMFKYFDAKMVKTEFEIPKLIYYKALVKQFIKHPILSSAYFLVNIYSKTQALKIGNKLTAKWPVALTTKDLKDNKIV